MSTGILDSSVRTSDSANVSMIEELAAQHHLKEEGLQQDAVDGEATEVFEEMDEEMKKEHFEKLKARYGQLEEKKQGLMKLFEQKLQELKDVCMQEAVRHILLNHVFLPEGISV